MTVSSFITAIAKQKIKVSSAVRRNQSSSVPLTGPRSNSASAFCSWAFCSWAADLTEAKTAASGLFDKLDKDGDSTLDHKEVHGRISEEEWAVADPANDKTISKDEYLAYVEILFKKADPDNDGTIDAKELSSPAGHALLRLLK
jgi:hypothetical protein